LIENCYANKKRIAEPWSETDSEPGTADRKASAPPTNEVRA
jgi:hypothetical protein